MQLCLGLICFLLLLFRSVKKSPAERYGKPVMVPSSDSGAGSDIGQGQEQGLSSTSDGEGEDAFPASYQPPLAGLMSKGRLIYHVPSSTCACMPCRDAAKLPVLLAPQVADPLNELQGMAQ